MNSQLIYVIAGVRRRCSFDDAVPHQAPICVARAVFGHPAEPSGRPTCPRKPTRIIKL